MRTLQFDISLAAADRVLCLDVRVPPAADLPDVEFVMHRIATAFASVERLDAYHMWGLLFSDMHGARRETAGGFLVRRHYSDPEYPVKVTRALKVAELDRHDVH